MQLYDLKTLHETEPLGIDRNPWFSWKLKSAQSNTMQHTYRITVSDDRNVVWDTGLVESDQSTFVPYAGQELKSCTRYTWTVTVQDNYGNSVQHSSWFETAFLYNQDWKASWVEAAAKVKKRKKGFGQQPAPTLFRRRFRLEQGIVSARLYATCHGIYEASINGKRLDDRMFAPEYTSYDKYQCYQIYDVTDWLQEGDNVLGMYVADGWYFSPNTAMSGKTAKQPHGILYQMEVRLADGSKRLVCSDGSEKTATGPVCFSDLFAGEQYDARLELPGWDTAEFDDSNWEKVRLRKESLSTLAAQIGTPVGAVKEIPVSHAYVSPKGEHILDFGQNIAGFVRFRVNVPEGTVITLEHFEIPDVAGNYFNNISGGGGVGEGCDQKVVYITGGKEAVYGARFSFQGFRYVRVSGLEEVDPENFTAVAISTKREETGTFVCSEPRLNRLYENTRWSQRANMISIPTDCPQREKAGWTGDIGIYAATSLQNEDTTSFLTRWLQSLKADQKKDGAVPMVVPFNQTYQGLEFILRLVGWSKGSAAVAGWGDACILVPLAMYEQTGNKEILKQQYDSMKAWCQYIIHTAKTRRGNKQIPKETDQYLWNTGFHYGEWLIPSENKNGMADGNRMKSSMKQGKKYIPQTYGFLAMKNMSRIARILEKEDDVVFYEDMAQRMGKAFAEGVITKNGRMPLEIMGSYIIPLHYGLVPEELRESFIEIILQKIRENGGCLDTGFLGTPVILDTLCENGHVDKAYDLLFQNKCPSWLYEVEHGATTIWESWITTNPDGSPMTISLNHYAFGCVDDWMFRYIAGLAPLEAGYKKFRVQPILDARITSASRTHETEYGIIRVSWKNSEDEFTMDVTVPCNTTAEVIMPSGEKQEVGSGSYSFTSCSANPFCMITGN